MRHRRRISTQTINRSKTIRVKGRKRPQKSNRAWAFLKNAIFFAVVIGILYLGYIYLLPVVKEKLPALDELSSGVSTPMEKVTERPELPVDKDDAQESPPAEPFLPALQVEILNGCGEQGVAKMLSDKLMALNYDVVNTGNYLKKGKPFFEVKKTRIIDQVNSEKTREKAQKLAEQIGISNEQIESFNNPNPIADITIIIGQDFKTLKIFKGKSE
ncbi:LytR C-terminal domain-containing protein [Calditrichota bacterium GD2]